MASPTEESAEMPSAEAEAQNDVEDGAVAAAAEEQNVDAVVEPPSYDDADSDTKTSADTKAGADPESSADPKSNVESKASTDKGSSDHKSNAVATAPPAPKPAPSKPVVTSMKPGKPKKAKMGSKYTFFVGPGNNSELVRQTIERRPWWELGKEDDPELNLKWLQVRNRTAAEWVRRMGSTQFLNHLDGLTSIGRKNELYSNLKAYCEAQRLNVHEVAPPTFIVSVGDNCPEYAEFSRICRQMESRSSKGVAAVKSVKNALGAISAMHAAVKAGSEAASESGASAAATEEATSEASDGSAQAGAAGRRAGAKAGAAKAEGSPTKRAGEGKSAAGAGAGAPGAAGGGAGGAGAAKAAKMNRADAIASTSTAGDKNIWIVKPTNNNRGNGIRVFKSFAAIEAHLQKKPPGTQVIVQKYIERPLLYRRRKFDIRCLVMVDPLMQIYVYRNAYLRTSTMEYSLDNVHDLFIHLTNYAVQKKNKKLDKNNSLEEDEMDEDDEAMEEGNNLSLDQLSAFLREEHPGRGDATDVMARIREIVVLVFMSVWRRLNPLRERNTFEVFGWDFLLDEDFRVWLIEVNTNPYIGCSSEILRGIFTGMLEGACRKCIDPFFPPPEGYDAADVEQVEGADLWDKVYPPDKDAAK